MDLNLNVVYRKKRSHSPASCSSLHRRRSAEDESKSDKDNIRRHSYKSLDESDSEKAGIGSRHFDQKSKYGKKKSRWEPLPTDIIKDYKKNNELFRPLTDMVDDKLKLAMEVINVVDDASFVEILPEFKESSEKIRQEFVHEMLLFMSRKRIISILNGHNVSDSSSTDTHAEMSPSISEDSNSDAEQMFSNARNVLRKSKSPTTSSERTNSFDNISGSSGSHHASPFIKSKHVNKRKLVKSKKLSSQHKHEEELEEGEIEDSDEGPVERISEDKVQSNRSGKEDDHTPEKANSVDQLEPISPEHSRYVIRDSSFSSASNESSVNEAGNSVDTERAHTSDQTDHEVSPEADNANGEVAEEELNSNRDKLPQQVPAVSTTTEGESDEYPEDLDLELLE
ncbi:hypothetical protein DdX_00729 [Ditylenchus destructor]|uniref:Uncharacterized protein n=1 Tax=Ditylenchus destructor TaxID=166010 RepID=A0AAD4R7I2_9BILA|nr:hypothetical protein DdX_00729 [Ditylenchus destructor]